MFVFFFQAEDGIRDYKVTGVQTCALPIWLEGEVAADPRRLPRYDGFVAGAHQLLAEQQSGTASDVPGLPAEIDMDTTARYTEDVLAGRLPVPPALTRPGGHIVHPADQIR